MTSILLDPLGGGVVWLKHRTDTFRLQHRIELLQSSGQQRLQLCAVLPQLRSEHLVHLSHLVGRPEISRPSGSSEVA